MHGSSPHTRGTRRSRISSGSECRFIPAYAGNAIYNLKAHPLPTVHPRIRGERTDRSPSARLPAGSSPHTRGTPPAGAVDTTGDRFIPAYAGNAPLTGIQQRLIPVHPRIRGERQVAHRRPGERDGSSPHTRGTPRHPRRGTGLPRFIPAYAGNAAILVVRAMWATVHPRIRGERDGDVDMQIVSVGSSPHTRGTPPSYGAGFRRSRFIPAYAGNALPVSY